MDIEWVSLLVTLVTAIIAASWAFWKWRQDRAKERKAEQSRIATRYVNPFLFACEDLQSRLYNILCEYGLGVLLQHYPEGRAAEETLYLFAQYFAYEPIVLRYTPYGTDPYVLRRIQQIRDDVATDNGGMDPWCFFRAQQRAIGRLVLGSPQGEEGTELDAVSFLDFQKNLDAGGAASLGINIDELLNSLEDAEGVTSTSRTRSRLAEVQTHLVELLVYLEEEMRRLAERTSFSLFLSGKRSTVRSFRPSHSHPAEDWTA